MDIFSMMFELLPNETVNIILFLLDIKDLYNISCVNIRFNTLFYKNINTILLKKFNFTTTFIQNEIFFKKHVYYSNEYNKKYSHMKNIIIQDLLLLPDDNSDDIDLSFFKRNFIINLTIYNVFHEDIILNSSKYLKKLICPYINIGKLPYLENLEYLNCSSCNLKELPHYKKLISLECDNNYLTYIPYYKYIDFLNCSNNNISFLDHLDTLTELICENNKLKCINLPNLKKLFCKENYIRYIAPNQNLSVLECSKNSLKHLTINKSLLYLNCAYNNINLLETFENIDYELHTLYCNNNLLKSIHNFTYLQILNCSDNYIQSLPDFKNLISIACNRNYISNLIETSPFLDHLSCIDNINIKDNYNK